MKNERNFNDDFPDFEQFTSSFHLEDNASSNSTNDTSSQSDKNNPFSNIDMNTILKIKQIMEKMNQKKDDPRANLLLSLKPYLKPSRKQKVDQYIELFQMGNIMENFGPMFMGGDKAK